MQPALIGQFEHGGETMRLWETQYVYGNGLGLLVHVEEDFGDMGKAWTPYANLSVNLVGSEHVTRMPEADEVVVRIDQVTPDFLKAVLALGVYEDTGEVTHYGPFRKEARIWRKVWDTKQDWDKQAFGLKGE